MQNIAMPNLGFSLDLPKQPVFNASDWLWELPDGRVWSTAKAAFITKDEVSAWLASHPEVSEQFNGKPQPSPVDKWNVRNLNGLIQALDFHKLPKGELATSEELFASLRAERDKRISATDYLLMTDYPISADALAEVEAYRTALRDLPAREGAPWDGGGAKTPWPDVPVTASMRSA